MILLKLLILLLGCYCGFQVLLYLEPNGRRNKKNCFEHRFYRSPTLKIEDTLQLLGAVAIIPETALPLPPRPTGSIHHSQEAILLFPFMHYVIRLTFSASPVLPHPPYPPSSLFRDKMPLSVGCDRLHAPSLPPFPLPLPRKRKTVSLGYAIPDAPSPPPSPPPPPPSLATNERRLPRLWWT